MQCQNIKNHALQALNYDTRDAAIIRRPFSFQHEQKVKRDGLAREKGHRSGPRLWKETRPSRAPRLFFPVNSEGDVATATAQVPLFDVQGEDTEK